MTNLLPPLEHAPRSGCLNCPPKPIKARLRWNPHPGFGAVYLLADGNCVASYYDGDRCPTFITFEKRAAAAPDHDWRVEIDGPLASYVYQRHAPKTWVVVEKGMGFA